MTNYFKELISFRSLHLMEETYLAGTIKEALCFVSQDVKADLKVRLLFRIAIHALLQASKQKGWASPFYKEFVLPDGVTNLRGFIRHEPKVDEDFPVDPKNKEQVLAVNNERFMVPEILFNPTDIGLNQSGLPETIVQVKTSLFGSL